MKSLLAFSKRPIFVPPSSKSITPVSESRVILEGVSNVIAPDEVPIVTAASPVVISSAAELDETKLVIPLIGIFFKLFESSV